MDELSGRIPAQRAVRTRVWSRLAFASAISVFVLGSFASLGGLSYAASGVSFSYDAARQIVDTHKLTVSVHKSSAAAQYPHQPSTPPAAKPKPPAAGVAAAAAVPSGKTLPFTGFSLLSTFVLSLALIAGGIILRRRERRN